ncbi:hypothetical protein FisN_17Lh284 [Fistulifera solaris]|uniref:PDZ domain-containing protein n=1 Tax=Fistulifera solaris TaxID=1519565 RepID=A0A1Z5J5Y6_FISSO|nr:hypothetical protein FisN_17Lh284 [Fistulifera solaris]|eukprot:GAX09248.1 hypothetical protein FisN_17Lh284 [Fistulifera solaris]
MRSFLSVFVFSLIAVTATAKQSPTTDGLMPVPAPERDSQSRKPTHSLLTMPTQNPTSYPELWKTAAPFPSLKDNTTSAPTELPSTPSRSASSLSPTTDFLSEFPSMVPSWSMSPSMEPSVAPVVAPTKRPTNGIIISSVKVSGLQMKLTNVGVLLETDKWELETEQMYNEYLEDMICSVILVGSQVSDDKRQVNTITFDLVLQSHFVMITNSMQYAVMPFQDNAANIQYGKKLRTLTNFGRLSLPIPVPETPQRGDEDDKDKLFLIGKLSTHAILGIVVAGLLGFIYAAYRFNLWSQSREQSKPSTEPRCTFRISSDDDVSTIGPIDEIMDSEKGEAPKNVDAEVSKSAKTMRVGNSLELNSSRNQGNEFEGELIDVILPAGKLGIVIDTPDNGLPVIHAVKRTSAVRDQLRVGDKLLAIDDEDIRDKTAFHVSKIISSKMFNPQRKFTIVRPYDIIHIT